MGSLLSHIEMNYIINYYNNSIAGTVNSEDNKKYLLDQIDNDRKTMQMLTAKKKFELENIKQSIIEEKDLEEEQTKFNNIIKNREILYQMNLNQIKEKMKNKKFKASGAEKIVENRDESNK